MIQLMVRFYIHLEYLRNGSDIICTNTFNATSIAQSDYGTQHLVHDINIAAVKLARDAAKQVAEETQSPRFVAGVLGPTNKTTSISGDVNDPGKRDVDFDLED